MQEYVGLLGMLEEGGASVAMAWDEGDMSRRSSVVTTIQWPKAHRSPMSLPSGEQRRSLPELDIWMLHACVVDMVM